MLQPGLLDFPKSDIPTGVTEWSNANGPFPELGPFQFTVSLPFELLTTAELI